MFGRVIINLSRVEGKVRCRQETRRGESCAVMNIDFNSVENVYGTTFYDHSWYSHHPLNLVVLAEYRLARRRRFALQFTGPMAGLVSLPDILSVGMYMNNIVAGVECVF